MKGKHLSEHRCKERKRSECVVSPETSWLLFKASTPQLTSHSPITYRTNSLTCAHGDWDFKNDMKWYPSVLQSSDVTYSKCFKTLKCARCVYGVHIQYLKGGDLVFEHFLGLVEVWQHVLRLSAVDGAQLSELPLVSLGQLLFVGPEEGEERMVDCQYW